jgi:hypothetical protein
MIAPPARATTLKLVPSARQQSDDSGSPVTWGEHVTDEQCASGPRDEASSQPDRRQR